MATQGIQCRGFVYIAINTYFYIASPLYVVKKYLLIFSFLFLPLFAAKAEDYSSPSDSLAGGRSSSQILFSEEPPHRFELNLGLGGEAYFASEEFMMGVMDVWYYGPSSVAEMYHYCYDVKISPTLSMGWAYNIHNRLAVVGSFGCNRVNAQYFNPFTNEEISREMCYRFDILVGARVYWTFEKAFACYSQIQLGVTFHSPGDYWSRNELSQKHNGFQLTAIGLSMGNHLFCFGELGWGTEYFAIGLITGIRVGAGLKF